jgi:hypothetical protein
MFLGATSSYFQSMWLGQSHWSLGFVVIMFRCYQKSPSPWL